MYSQVVDRASRYSHEAGVLALAIQTDTEASTQFVAEVLHLTLMREEHVIDVTQDLDLPLQNRYTLAVKSVKDSSDSK